MNPVVTGDLVLAGSCSGTLFAFERDGGAVRWAHSTEPDGYRANFHGQPWLGDGMVVIGTDSPTLGHVYALELETGDVRWKFDVSAGMATDLVRVDDTIVGVTLGDQVLALDAATGKLRWSAGSVEQNPEDYRTERFQWTSSPATDGKRIYWGSLAGELTALDAADGSTVWRTELGDRVSTAVLLAGRELIAGTADGRVHRVRARDGEPLSSFDLGSTPRFQITPIPAGLLFLLQPAHSYVALDRKLRRELWRVDAGETWSSFRPALWKGSLLLGESLGDLVALDPATGAVRWRQPLEENLRGLGGDDATIYCGTLGGRLYAFRPGGR